MALACEAISATIPVVGAFCMQKNLPQLMEALQLLFGEKAPCQDGQGEEDGEEEDEDDHDQVLIDGFILLLLPLLVVVHYYY